MKLKYQKRNAERKSENKQLRRDGAIPAVLYARGQDSKNISIESAEYASFLRDVQPGRLSTTIVELIGEDNVALKAVFKDIQYHPTTYDVLHLDFEALNDSHEVNINVPIECTSVAECVGVKLGGVLRMVVRKTRVRCLPENIPTVFQIDVKTLGVRESRRLKDIQWPENVRPLDDLNQVAAIIAKR